jgi:nitrogen fixation/metabolism regulation signal transduction histidine kinase
MSKGPVDAEVMSRLRHDIKNQLSTIHMALEAINYEVPNPSEDFTFCMNTILTSVTKINDLLKEPK